MDRLIDIEALASILSLAPRTVRNRLSQNPASLPPRVWVPGTRGPRWRLSDVQDWLESLPTVAGPQIADPAADRRRGPRRRVIPKNG
ncbi:hypothetical protein F0726_00114 [Acidithiobacillus caldus]|nr:hypothetical protein F0726_00114 [Acidithiobacillus caldus]